MAGPATESRRHRWLAVLSAVAALVASPPTGLAQQAPLEAAVKAAYLAKFAPFVSWPPGAAGVGPFFICIIGSDPFGAALDQVTEGQQVGGRPIEVRRLATARPDAPCQVAFLGGSPGQSIRDAVKVLHGAPILTVTDSGGDASGVVDFMVAGGRVRFRIDDEAAAEDGLAISSKLLSLAVAVTPRKAAGAAP
jgi:hypothetical protein